MFLFAFLSTFFIAIGARSMHNKRASPDFYVIPLGTTGGLDENNLSAYIVTSVKDNTPNSAYVSLDGGTIRHGIRRAIESSALPSQTDVDIFFREQIKAYLISHGHYDHLGGFLLNTPNDVPGKFVIGINETINIIKSYYFTQGPWIDLGPTGFKIFDYIILDSFSNISIPIPNTDLNVRGFRLCHICPYLSSAFLVSRRNEQSASILYFGDTGADDHEKIILPDNTTYYPRYFSKLWRAVAPLVVADQLKAIFIEVSFPNDLRSDDNLFGHLTPKWLLKELNVLRGYHSLKNVKIIVTHIKPGKGFREKIIEELTNGGGEHYDFIFPEQGQAIWL